MEKDRAGTLELIESRLSHELLQACPIDEATDSLRLRFALTLAKADAAQADRLLSRLAGPEALYARHQLALAAGRFPDAVALARTLAEKTSSKELLAALILDRRLLPFLKEPPTAPTKWKATEEQAIAATQGQRHWLVPTTPGLPSESVPLQFEPFPPNSPLRFVDPSDDKVLATVPISTKRAQVEAGLTSYLRPLTTTRAGRVLLVSLGEQLFAIDAISHKLLWSKDRLGQENVIPQSANLVWLNQKAGWYEIRHPEGWSQVGGFPVACSGGRVAIASRTGLQVLDLETGAVLWHRRELSGDAMLIALGERLLSVEVVGGRVRATRWLRMDDGSSIDGPDLTVAFTGAVQRSGPMLLTAVAGTHRILDLATLKETWNKELPAGSVMLTSEVPGVFGWIQPDGAVCLMDLTTATDAGFALLDPMARNVTGGTILADGRNLYVTTLVANPKPEIIPQGSGFSPTLPLRFGYGTGQLLAIDRAKKKLVWVTEMPGMYVGLSTIQDLPLVVLSAQRPKRGVNQQGGSEFRLIDPRTGKMVFDKTFPAGQFWLGLKWSPETSRLEMIGNTARVKVVPEE